MTTIAALYQTLQTRKRPEDIAEMIRYLLADKLSPSERNILEKAANGSLAKNAWGYTAMLQDFGNVVGAGHQVAAAVALFQLKEDNAALYDDPIHITNFLQHAAGIIHKTVGKNDFRHDRLNREEREILELDISKRRYNKKWRMLKRIERKLQTILRETKKLTFQKVAKHGLGHTISFETFSADIYAACFIAYYNARCNLRSVFTNKKQERPFDEICDMLFMLYKRERAEQDPARSAEAWWAISHIYATQEVLWQLTDKQRGILLGQWTTILQDIAAFLEELWYSNSIDRRTMIVKKGNDSSTWNNTAGAWNKARDNWMQLVYSLGMDMLLEEVCFGKVLRLIAGDVAAWHFASGGKLDPNTSVWAGVPLPWEVLTNRATCNKDLIIQHCKGAGLHAEQSGWIAPKTHGVVPFTPTPELVYGVSISNPYIAAMLKRSKYFSGKGGQRIFPEKN
ncbi:hypothetical protein CK934_22250 [Chitinophaga sp. MD30]|nr:hypothetical protein CK934_22250 [Chitinophaga sp. MD30]